MIWTLLRLFLTGDYTPAMRPARGEEDSALVDAILSARYLLGS